jgi:hypothetical protein
MSHSASASSVGGMVGPSALAVSSLITSSLAGGGLLGW